MDYIKLYKWFTYTQQSSYRLDFIGQLEVGIGKIEYEGTLQNLYETDINKYVEYNLNDVVIIKALDDGLVLDRKGVNFPGVGLDLNSLTDVDNVSAIPFL